MDEGVFGEFCAPPSPAALASSSLTLIMESEEMLFLRKIPRRTGTCEASLCDEEDDVRREDEPGDDDDAAAGLLRKAMEKGDFGRGDASISEASWSGARPILRGPGDVLPDDEADDEENIAWRGVPRRRSVRCTR